MIHRTNVKLNHILVLYFNGASAQAKAELKKLKKKELAQLLILTHQLEQGVGWTRERRVDFEDWVLRALDA